MTKILRLKALLLILLVTSSCSANPFRPVEVQIPVQVKPDIQIPYRPLLAITDVPNSPNTDYKLIAKSYAVTIKQLLIHIEQLETIMEEITE